MITSYLLPYLSEQYADAMDKEIENTLNDMGYSLDDVKRLMDEQRMTIYIGTSLDPLAGIISVVLDDHELFHIDVSFSGDDGPQFKKTIPE